MDTNYNNFCANAILSQREVCCIADEMLEKCKENKLDLLTKTKYGLRNCILGPYFIH